LQICAADVEEIADNGLLTIADKEIADNGDG